MKISNYETLKVKEVPYKGTRNTSEFFIRNLETHIVNVRLHISQVHILSSGVFEGETLKELYKAEYEFAMRCAYEWFKYVPQLKNVPTYNRLVREGRDHMLYGTGRSLTDAQVRDKVEQFSNFLILHYLPMLNQFVPLLESFAV